MIKITLTAIIQIRATIAYMLHLLLYVTSVYISLLRNFIQKLHLNHVILMAHVSQNVYARKKKKKKKENMQEKQSNLQQGFMTQW